MQPDFATVAATALQSSRALVPAWIPGGHIRGAEYVAGSIRGDKGESFSVNLNTGKWADFATGDKGGDLISLYAAQRSLSQGDALKQLSAELGAAPVAATRPPPPQDDIISPVPDNAPAPHFRHPDFGTPAAHWTYRDAAGRTLGYVCRFNLPDGSKQILPFSFTAKGWRWKSLTKPRPLYIPAPSDAPVLIVEGEKCADAAQAVLPGWCVVTWPGGSSAIAHADWSGLKGRSVTVWPDNDAAGQKAADWLSRNLGTRSIAIPDGKPAGWDVADALAEGMEIEPLLRAPAPTPEYPADDYDAGEIVETEQAPFRCLGYNRGDFYFLTRQGKQVLGFSARSLRDKAILFQLAPMDWWEMNYRSDRGFSGQAVDQAVNALIQTCYARGVFRPDRIRGRGAWWDAGRSVVHLGDRLIVDGAETALSSHASHYLYEASEAMALGHASPLAAEEAHRLHELCNMLAWERPIYGSLLAGWCVVAPVCGALSWRPHIWVTAPAGGGKSWVMDNIVQRCIGEAGLVVQSRTTEAGLRQTLGQDARPVIFDEAEGENSRAAQTIENVLALMRQASSEGGGRILKGTTHGKAMSFDIRSCFAFSSIGVGVQHHADATRVSVLSLIKEDNAEARDHFTQTVKPLAHELLTPEWCARLQARTVRNLPTLRANAEIFAEAAAEKLESRRLGDQVGALLAGAHLLHSTKRIGLEAAREWVNGRDWADQAEIKDDRDEMKLIAYLMQVVVDTSKHGQRRSFADLVARIAGEVSTIDDVVSREESAAILARHGLRVEGANLCISNTHSALARLLKETPWSTGWHRILKRVDGALASAGVVRFGHSVARAVMVPVNQCVTL